MSDAAKTARQDPEGIEFVDAQWDVRQVYRPDPMLVRFFESLKSKVLLGALVAETGRVIFPPMSFCEVTYQPVERLVPVGPLGTIRAFTVVHTKFANGPPPPHTMVFVQLDGASTASPGYLKDHVTEGAADLDLIGARCRAVFKDDPAGEWQDFWFELERHAEDEQ